MNQAYTRSALFTTPNNKKSNTYPLRKGIPKRKKSRWRDRISPQPPKEEPQEDVIDEEKLTRCKRCPTHRKRTGRFRPLIDNGGEYLCDSCYQTEFPLTQMLDDEENAGKLSDLKRSSMKATNTLRNTIVDTTADVLGHADAATSLRAKNDNDSYPSEVECRMCLEHGVFRRCCHSYYCHHCYYKNGTCPSCETEAPLTGIVAAKLKPDPGKFAVGISWAFSFMITLITVVGIALIYTNASTVPMTIWGHHCLGYFSKCEVVSCIDYDGENEYGKSGGFVPAAQPYKVCDREVTINQVVASACVYDSELYAWSNHTLGYDLCVSSPREESSRPRNVSDTNPLLLYSGNKSGIYVFDDDFEQPAKVSSPWSEIINGNHSNACGINTQHPERGNHAGFEPVANSKALLFTGVQTRHAITARLNVEHGGRVEFYLKMGPLTEADGSTSISECKPAFSDVTLEYKTSLINDDWVTFGTYPAYLYRGQEFKFVSQDIPQLGWSKSTQFRFRQASFEALRDFWALDDVRVFASLRPQWQESDEFRERQVEQNESVVQAQCCYNTDQCSVFDKKRTNFDDRQCETILPDFDPSKRRDFRLKLSELMIFYLCLAAIIKSLYQIVVERFTRRNRAREDNNTTDIIISQNDNGDEQFPRKSFYSVTQLSWQFTIAFILFTAFGCTLYRLLDKLMAFQCLAKPNADEPFCGTDGSFIVCCCIAAMFDVRAMYFLLSQVFGIEHPWKCNQLEVVVDLNPDQSFMRVGSKTIPLSEVSDVESQSAAYCWLQAVLHILAGLPLALGSLTLSSFDLPARLKVCTSLLGSLAILREVFGTSFFGKLYLTIRWILTMKQTDRDELGRAMKRKGLLQLALIGCLFAFIVFGITSGRRADNPSTSDNFIILLVCVSFGGLLGLLIGVMHGVPVVPDAKLIGWPSACCCVSFYDQMRFPCLFSCTYCSDMNSRHVLLIIALDDIYAFKRILQGRQGNDLRGKGNQIIET